MSIDSTDVVVVGGGLGGLVAATIAARRGLRVHLLERARAAGGRAATQARQGFHFNVGAHALYAGGAATRVLRSLGVRWTGRAPGTAGLAVHGDEVHPLPSTVGALLRTGLLRWRAKVQGARLLGGLSAIDSARLMEVPLDVWLAANVSDPTMRATFEAFVRVATYTDAPSVLSAGAALEQLRLAQRPGVLYLDGGWGSLVTGVTEVARAAGVQVSLGAAVVCAHPVHEVSGEVGWRVQIEGAETLHARALVLATGPAAARSIVASEALASWAHRAVPVKAACLDVALSRLPSERATFALGVDRPLYLSVHSKAARLAPEGAALVSTMKYLRPGEATDPARDEAELEGLLDRLQPGWRAALVQRRWLPSVVASNAVVGAAHGGLAGRPGPAVPDAPGVFVVGDWIGGEGMLLDASLASAERAALDLGERLAKPGQGPAARVA